MRSSEKRPAVASIADGGVTISKAVQTTVLSLPALFPTTPFVWELLDEPGREPQQFSLPVEQAVSLYNEAVAGGQDRGAAVAG